MAAIGATIKLSNGVLLPRFGVGTWRQLEKECGPLVAAAMEYGYPMIDTAQIYENEAFLGANLAKVSFEHPEWVPPRKDKSRDPKRTDPYPVAMEVGNPYGIFLTTKLWMDRVGPTKTMESVKQSLSDLRVAKIDLLLLHWPAPSFGNMQSPKNRKWRHDTWRTIEEVYEKGLARAIGVANFDIPHLEQLIEDGVKIKPMVNQFEASPQCTMEPLRKYCKDNDIAVIAYSSLGGTDGTLREIPTVKAIGEKIGQPVGNVLLRWALQNDMAIIPGTSKPQRMRDNLDVFGFEIPEGSMRHLDNIGERDDIHLCPDPRKFA